MLNYRITSDIPGRLRLRFGNYVFNEKQGYTLEQQLKENQFIERCVSNHINGSILIEYTGSKADILQQVRSIDFDNLSESEAPQGDRRQLNRHFQNKVMNMVFWKWVGSAFFPYTLYKAWTVARALPYIKSGLSQLLNRKIGVSVLDATSISIALIQQEFSTASNIMFFLGLSEKLEEYTTERVQMDLIRSLAINVDQVWKVNEQGVEESVPFETIKKNDIIRVRTGYTIPVDGIVLDGEGFIDESSMTGESRLVEKRKNSTCYAGTVLADGNLTIQVNQTGNTTKRHKIIDEISAAGKGKSAHASNAQRWADRLVPYHFIGAGLIYALTRNIQKTMSVLLVDYSCAIRLCSPLAILSAIREAADSKIVIKGGKHLEKLAESEIFLFDKTGTLTNAKPRLVKIITANEQNEDEMLRVAACIEEHFPHSVARAVVEAAKEKNLKHEELHGNVEYVVAHGIRSSLDEKSISIGSAHFLFDDEKILPSREIMEKLAPYEDDYSPLYLAIDKELVAVFLIDDPARSEAKEALQQLRNRGVKEFYMITGDSEKTAKRIANQLHIDHIYSQVLPDEKSKIVRQVQKSKGSVVMVGDGINDSPALARSDVSIAMKDASDIAREVCDIVLMRSDLMDLARLRDLSDAMNQRISRNLLRIISFNSLLILSGVFGILASTQTALLHNASTLLFATQSGSNYNILNK